MAAIVQAAQAQRWQEVLGVRVAAVISNRSDAKGLKWAQDHDLPIHVVDHKAFGSRALFDQALQQCADAYAPDLVVLAGFMRILTPEFVGHYAGKLINIHPSLLPAFTGLNTHQRALDAGCHVFAEKPACVRIEDFIPLVQKADARHLNLMLALANG